METIIDLASQDPIHKLFREKKAKLVITQPDYAYIECGKMRFYFHSTSQEKSTTREMELMSGEKVIQNIIPYDGWELVMENA